MDLTVSGPRRLAGVEAESRDDGMSICGVGTITGETYQSQDEQPSLGGIVD